eukprot:7462625-Karenia_brevis.AAC.1
MHGRTLQRFHVKKKKGILLRSFATRKWKALASLLRTWKASRRNGKLWSRLRDLVRLHSGVPNATKAGKESSAKALYWQVPLRVSSWNTRALLNKD